jgi:8-oxo-dGTP diphosphatase
VLHDVVAGLLVRDGRVLLCHRAPDREWYPDVWDLPGGHIEDGEVPGAALVRELTEELDVRVTVPDAPIVEVTDDDAGLRLTVWRIDAWQGEPTNGSPDEHDELGWFTPAELTGLALAHPSYPELLRAALTTPR